MIKKYLDTYFRDGLLTPLTDQMSTHNRSNGNPSERIKNSLVNLYWNTVGGTQSFSIDGTEAEFEASTNDGGDIIRWTYDLEKKWLKDLLDVLETDDVFFDVGANLGFYSCFAVNKVTNGRVIAFEPYPPNVDQLETNIAHNASNFDVFDKALTNERDTVQFTEPASEGTGHATGTVSPDGETHGYNVETVPGDELVANGVPQPDVIKIDVEGSEPLVVDGLEETLRNNQCRVVFLEIHLPKEGRPSLRDYDSSPDELKNRLESFGYEITQTDRRNQEEHVVARR